MNINRNTIVTLGLALLLIGAVAMLAGVATAETNTTELVNKTDVEVTNDTESVWVDVTGAENMSGADPIDVDVTFAGLDEAGDLDNSTELHNETLSVGEDATESVDLELTDDDRENYEAVHILVEVHEDDEEHVSVEWGTTVSYTGGAGGGVGGSGIGTGAIVVVVLIGAAIVMSRD